MRLFVFFLLCFLGFFCAGAQIDSLKVSEQYYREGMDAFNFSHRKQAVELFKQAVGFNPQSDKACLMAAKSIMLTIHKEQSLPYLKKAYKLNPLIDEDILFLIGQAYHYNEQFDSALWYYDHFNRQLSRSLQFSRVAKMNEVNWKIFECRNAQLFKANPVQVTIENLGPNVNSEWPDYAPTISADESTMIFTTRRPDNNNNASLAEDLEYYEEIFMSKRVDGVWQPARKVEELNSDFHDASVSLSPDGKEMFVYSDENGGDIYETDQQPDGAWTNPKRLNGFINSPYFESSAAVSADLQKLFFVSDRPDGYGGTDIYVALKNKRGDWTQVINLGPTINTPRDEEDVFVAANGQHIYFSSNGHAGMGDLDIYRSTFDSATMKWSEPMNLGYPVNSVENDIFFVLTGDERFAYISSMRTPSRGEQDIYRVDLVNWKPVAREALATVEAEAIHQQVRAAEVETKTPAAQRVSPPVWHISVRDENGAPVDAALQIHHADRSDLPVTRMAQGLFQTMLPAAADLRLHLRAEAEGFEPYTSSLRMVGASDSAQLSESVVLKRIARPSVASASFTVFHETNQVVPQNTYVLDLVAAMLREQPSATVNIVGHTDTNGDEAYNALLSRQRAMEAKKYLEAKGIEGRRISVDAQGEAKPLANNATLAGRRLNRRTELVIK